MNRLRWLLKEKLTDLYLWIRFGDIKEVVVDSINGISCEIKYIGRNNKVIGYWAYGYWCPDYPYKK